MKPRHFGRTSILRAAAERLESAGAVRVRFDAEVDSGLEDFSAALAVAAARRLRGGVERTGEQVRRFFGRLQPQASYDVANGEWIVRLEVGRRTPPHPLTLVIEAFAGPERLTRAQPHSLRGRGLEDAAADRPGHELEPEVYRLGGDSGGRVRGLPAAQVLGKRHPRARPGASPRWSSAPRAK